MKNRKKEFERLRALAKAALAKQDPKEKKKKAPPADLLQELEIYQAELEVQNEELKKIHEDLTESRRRYFELYELAPVGYFTLDPEGLILEANMKGADLLGTERGRLIKRPFIVYVTSGGHPAFYEHRQQAALSGAPQRCELRLLRKGAEFFGLLESRPIFDSGGRFVMLLMTLSDLTERRQMEEDLRKSRDELEMRTARLRESEDRLGALASELINAQETERKRIAHELHDGLAAQLAAVKYRVEHRFKNGESTGGITMVKDTIKDIERAMTEIRRIMANLRPSILDDLGIIPAFSWYAREFGDTYPGTSVEYSGNIREADIPDNLKIVLFRVAQEAVTNASRHGKAPRIQIGLENERNWLRLSVMDNGNGFESLKRSPTGGIGLDSMQQRVESTGGLFSITSSPGQGTIVKAEWKIV